jgi:hypothetical protein
MKRSVGLRQPRLDCAVVMSHEPINKGFDFASLASVHCHSTANLIIIPKALIAESDCRPHRIIITTVKLFRHIIF